MKIRSPLMSCMSMQFLAPTILLLGLMGCDGDDSSLESNYFDSGGTSVNPVTVVSTSNHEIFIPSGYRKLEPEAAPQGDYEGAFLFGGSNFGIEEIAAFIIQRPTLGSGSDANSVLQNLRTILSSMEGIQLSNVVTENLSETAMRSNDRITLVTPLTVNALNNLIFERLGGNIEGAQFTNLPADNPQAPLAQEYRCLLTVQYFNLQDIVITSTVIRESELVTYEAMVEGIGDGSNVGNRGSQRRASSDQFEVQSSSNKADFLWVVDNSGSMGEEQQAVANAGTEFTARVSNANLDFQVGVITTDSDQLRGIGFTSDIVQFQTDIIAGINGSGSETGIWFAEQSLQAVTLGDSFDGSVTSFGVPRNGASLSVIILSDEKSQYEIRSGGITFDTMNNLFRDRGYLVYAIVLPEHAQESQYDDLALNTGGTIGDISDLSSIPAIIQQIVDRAGGMTPFILSHRPISSTMLVKIDGTEVLQAAVDGWQYFPNSNTIAFFGNAMPQAGDTVQVAYEYIEAALDSVLEQPFIKDGTSYEVYRQQCVDTINNYRATENLPPLQRWQEQETCTDEEAKLDSESEQSHGAFGRCQEKAQNECPGYLSLESTISTCLQQMWEEGPGEPYEEHGHYINMTNTAYTKVACGFYETPSGNVWAIQNFK